MSQQISIKLSEHFRLHEFTRSEYAARNGIDMTPPASVIGNLANLCGEVLEPLRASLGPLYISSGFRPQAVNLAIGGAPNSDHLRGMAADFIALDHPTEHTAKIVRGLASSLPVAKVIYEYGQWIHVSLAPNISVPARSLLVASREAGQTVYKNWSAA